MEVVIVNFENKNSELSIDKKEMNPINFEGEQYACTISVAKRYVLIVLFFAYVIFDFAVTTICHVVAVMRTYSFYEMIDLDIEGITKDLSTSLMVIGAWIFLAVVLIIGREWCIKVCKKEVFYVRYCINFFRNSFADIHIYIW